MHSLNTHTQQTTYLILCFTNISYIKRFNNHITEDKKKPSQKQYTAQKSKLKQSSWYKHRPVASSLVLCSEVQTRKVKVHKLYNPVFYPVTVYTDLNAA